MLLVIWLVVDTGMRPPRASPALPAGVETPSANKAASSFTPSAATASPAIVSVETASPPVATASPSVVNYLLLSRERLSSLPMTGRPWEEMKATADAPLGNADLTDQDNRHGVRTLAAALVYARSRDPTYGEKAREAIMEAVGSERVEAEASILALGRQLGAYVLAADFVELAGEDDREFREWLDDIRTRQLGGHGRWKVLTAAHEDAPNNWGSFAGASRLAASLYLGDTADVAEAALVLRGFMGDRAAWSAWQALDGIDAQWACDPQEFAPVNPPCTLEGIDLDGAIVADISRGGRLRWPPRRVGILYTNESLQGLALQAELLHMAGYDPWEWSDQALMRAALFLDRAEGWNKTSVSRHIAWIFNYRYTLSLPTEPAGYGRLLGYTDWLYAPD